jgi:uncharacterized protein (TIGR00299 family) protein
MKTLHFECSAGISGDMVLGAFADLGLDTGDLLAELAKLGIGGWKLGFVREERCGITGTRALVEIEGDSRSQGHSGPSGHTHEGEQRHEHEHTHEHQGGHTNAHTHTHEGGHSHEHTHQDAHGHQGGHSHNSWKEIRSLIEGAGISEGAKKRALDIFSRIARAESQVHGVPVDDIAFHEVGALDSIIDIVGAAVCLDMLRPERVTCGEIELGGGTVRCAHGELPVPAPATLILCKGLPVKTGGFPKEMTTPTGAAILASCVDEFVSRACFTEIKTGYGIGRRKLDRPNVLRVSWREDTPAATWNTEELVLIEANIDDMSGEALGFLMEELFGGGALDVSYTPCVMKKSRPGVILRVLCRPTALDSLRRLTFRASSTIGLREIPLRRLSLPRQEDTVAGDFGQARRKTVFLAGKPLRSKIEYEDRARVAREKGVSLEEADALIRGGEGAGTADRQDG